ncbi:MAG: CoA transferase [Methylocystis sp.]|nr:CoA transferase [Methylocystis sp.]MCA3583712.1 CoA transferase [Methylocystis sp.]MCA3587724.1 CoA transferase [Methylocystis sp.]MCA3590014.1 CoA transferase [Methylocystis sp.]
MSDPLPLAGIKAVEFSHMVMGPSCGLILADLGADVVKVEPAPDGDNTRRLAGSGAGFFAAMNRNKRSIALDLKSAEGAALARKLIAGADVMLENFRPGALDKMGFGYEALSRGNPKLIYCSLKGFLAGPYENRTALDEVVQMMGGLAYMTGPPGRPLRAGASVNDIMGGMFGVIGILAALNERHRTGRGQLVTSGLFETNMFLVAQHMLQFAVTGKPANPMPERLAAWAVYDVFDVADGEQVFVAVVSDTQWRAFCDAFDLADLKDAPGLGSNRERVLQRERFLPRLRTLFAAWSKADLAAECERIGLPFAPIGKPHELFDDPHLNHPGAMVTLTLEDGRTTPAPALPIALKGDRLALRRDLPRVGEHGREIAAELGYDAAAIAELSRRGILGGDPV